MSEAAHARDFHHKGESAYQKQKGYVVLPYITLIYSSVKPQKGPFCWWGLGQHMTHLSGQI